jgi:hypothetical protein
VPASESKVRSDSTKTLQSYQHSQLYLVFVAEFCKVGLPRGRSLNRPPERLYSRDQRSRERSAARRHDVRATMLLDTHLALPVLEVAVDQPGADAAARPWGFTGVGLAEAGSGCRRAHFMFHHVDHVLVVQML